MSKKQTNHPALALLPAALFTTLALAVPAVTIGQAAPAFAATGTSEGQRPLTLRTMGSLFFGGTVTKAADGETFHGDHGYAQYFVPERARTYPVVLWHGIMQSGRSYETTPDGREGFMSILPRRDWATYIVDQPRRGRAARTATASDPAARVPTMVRESALWDAGRVGVWTPPQPARTFPGLQIPLDPGTVEQLFRSQVPDVGAHPFTAEHRAFMGQTMAALFRQTGPGILVTHSHSGQYGWATAMKAPELVKAVVAYEPGQFAFPEGQRPAEIPALAAGVKEAMAPQMVPVAEFKRLTGMPIMIVYGDNISREPSKVFNVDLWRVASARAQQFVDAVNRHGGNAQLVILPRIGIKGNTHFMFADLNNHQIADHLERFLAANRLDGRQAPHQGPTRLPVTQYTIPLEK